jgi:hypothetical protein
MIRIYCDWNNRIDEERFDLHCVGSLKDIELHAADLKDGLRVMLYQTDELEAEGTLAFDEAHQRWIGIPDWSTMRYIGRSAEYEKRG